jgi:hypothetical protein
MKKIFMIVAILLLAGLFTKTAFAVTVFPSTNEANIEKNWGSVAQLTMGEGTTDLEFTSKRNFMSCFEYRTDGDTSQVIDENGGDNYNTLVTDGMYPYVCVKNSVSVKTITANEYVEVRMAFGAESDERFDWTRFEVIPVPEPVIEEDTGTYVAPKNVFHKDTRCHAVKPEVPTWSRYIPNMLTWSAVGGDKVEVKFGFSETELPYSIVLTNDGHEVVGLGTDTGWWAGYWRIRTLNGCSAGDWSPVLHGTGSW